MNNKNEFGQILGERMENFKPATRPFKITITGQYCNIETLDIDKHSKQLFASLQINNQGESWTYLPYGPFDSYEEFRNWLESIEKKEPDTVLYVILNKDETPIGICGYLRINPEHAVIEMGHVHFSNLLSKSIAATEAMYLMMKQAFENLGYRRYEWKCNSLNEPSIKAAKRLGFKYEGTFRQSNVFKNHNRDTAWFSIIDSEWPELKARFMRWLDQSNFNKNGQQIKSLSEI